MDPSPNLVDALWALVTALGGSVIKRMDKRADDQQAEINSLRNKVSDIDAVSRGSYVTRQEFTTEMHSIHDSIKTGFERVNDNLKADFERIYDKLERKEDKSS